MKKFVFELQTLQDMKKKEKDIEKIQLRKIEDRLNALLEVLNKLDFELNRTKKAFTEEVNRPTKAHNLNHYNNYLKKTSEQIAVQNNKIYAENQRKTACLNKIVEIQKELKSLDKLKQKKYEEYLKSEKKEEEKRLDDIVSFKIAAS